MLRIAVLLVVALIPHSIVLAQGAIMSASGPVSRGMGGASTAAPISAIGANYWNPATISGLESNELEFGMDLLFINHTASSTLSGNSGTTEGEAGTFPIPTVGWVYHSENPRVTYGLGVNGIAGFKTNLPVDPTNPILAPVPSGGLGRISSEASFMQICPSIAYLVNDRLSIAAGPVVTTAQVSVTPFILDAANGNGTYSSGSGTQYRWGGGAQAGIYYVGENCWHAGASLKTPAWMDTFEYYSEDQNGAPRLLEADLDLPLIFSLGLAYSGYEDWVLAMDGRFVDYANADGWGDPAEFDGTGALQGLDYSSVFALSLGAQRRVNDKVYLRAGYTYNQNPIADNESFFNLASPLIYEHMISGGLSYMLNNKLALNVAYSYMFENSRQGPIVLPGVGAVPGSSLTNEVDVHFLSLGIVLRQ